MKKGKIFTNCLMCIWLFCTLNALVSCSADNDDNMTGLGGETTPTETPFSVVLKAYSENEDITAKGDVSNTTLYIFNENNDFYKQIVVNETYLLQAKPIEIDCPGSEQITIIAWSGISTEKEDISTMSQANFISDLQLTLKQSNGIANNYPSDLFHGQITLKRNLVKSNTPILKISRKVSALTLTTKGILKVYDSREGSFYYKLKKTKSSFNYNGDLTGSDVEYIIPATLNEKGILIAGSTPILPASDITIELYRDDKIIFSTKNIKKEEKVSAKEGEQVCVIFDVSKKDYDIVISSWGTVIQHVTID